jgi:putative signal transducing protein
MSENFVEIFLARNLPDAYIKKATLEGAGIKVIIENEYLQAAIGELPPGPATAPRLMVPAIDADRALRLLQSTRENEADG